MFVRPLVHVLTNIYTSLDSSEVRIFHAAFHDGRAGSKGRVLAYPDDCCPKLLQIAQAVVAEPLKSVIMMLGFLKPPWLMM